MKEMTNIASTVMTDEEKAEMEREMKAHPSPSGTPPTKPASASTSRPTSPIRDTFTPNGHSPTKSRDEQPPAEVVPASPAENSTASSSLTSEGTASPSPEQQVKKKGKQKLTVEQRKKLDELEKERRKAMEERVKMLVKKLIERIRPYVEAKNPGQPDDPETIAFEKKIQLEADDLKLESFGVEVPSNFFSSCDS